MKKGVRGANGFFAIDNLFGQSAKPQKYHAEKLTVDGATFDSGKEYSRWCELCLLARAGEISGLRRQVPYNLIPPQREPDTVGARGGVKPGKLIERGVDYIADFVYRDKAGNTVVEDAKGVRTKEYIIKRKLMLWVNGIRVREV